MSNSKQKTGEGRDKLRSPEWYAAVRAEAQAFIAHVRARAAAARAARDEAKAKSAVRIWRIEP
jgi:hypothetical protein